MRVISMLIIHCSAVMPMQHSSVQDIDTWHRQQGWAECGYHYVVRRNGAVEKGRPEERIGAHCKGHNSHSVGVCYEGGLDSNGKPADTRTKEQKAALRELLEELKERYPNAIIVGHNVFSNKDCPCFDVVNEYWDLQP